MAFISGQGVYGRIQFKDGAMPEYDRTYLVVSVSSQHIKVINVSSIKGKERKLAFPTNKALHNYNPPFLKPSFVKLDSLTEVALSDCSDLALLHNGATLDKTELDRILELLNL